MNTPLRILVVLPLYGGSLPIGRYCAQALRDLGHLVEEFDAPAFHQAHVALRGLRISGERLAQLETAFLNTLSQAVYAKAESFAPDLVLALAQAPLGRQTLRRLRADGVPTAMWFVEDYALFTYWRSFAPLYDFFFVIQKEPFLSLLRETGVENACYLPLAALPSFHRPLELTAAERARYGADLAFLGAGYPNRRAAFRALAGRNFKIWGSDWDGDAVLAPLVQRGGARVSPEDSVRVYNATRVNLNLHSSVRANKAVSGGDFVNPRTFEIAAMGAFQLVDRRSLLGELFRVDESVCAGAGAPDPAAELAVFSDWEGLERGLTHYLVHPEEREAMARRARARVLADHTYIRRMTAMLDFIRARRSGWPAPRPTADWPPDIPEALRTELAALLRRLDLPPQAAFSDVVTRLRQESGVLGSLETSLLFLDEWRKQYGSSGS